MTDQPGQSDPGEVEQQILLDRLVSLAHLIAEVAGATHVKAVADIVTTSVADVLGADAASLSLREGPGELMTVGSASKVAVQSWGRFPIDAVNVASETVRTRSPVVATSLSEIHQRWPGHFASETGPRSLVCFPLAVGDNCLGALGLSFPEERDFSNLDMRYLQALADTCAQAVQRIQATDAAAESAARLTFLADASAELAASLDYEATLKRVADLAVPSLADWCTIDLLDEGSLRRVAAAHVDPSKAAYAHELWERYPPQMDAPSGAAAVVRTGVSELIEMVDDALLDQLDIEPDVRSLVGELQLRSSISVPLATRNQVLGVLTLVWAESGRQYSPADVPFVEDLARRAAVAIDNSRLHTDVTEAALQLQRAVLPETYNDSATWHVAVHYRPAGRAHLVGGDFYDALTLSDGRLVALVGDVMGRGVAAAAAMAQIRAACRAYLTEDPDPVQVISRLDAMFAELDFEQLVTILYVVLDPAVAQAEVVAAGHLPPLLVKSDGTVTAVDVPVSPPLGTGRPARASVTVPFGPTDTLLVYTDGLVERRGEDIDRGTDRLLEAASGLAQAVGDADLARLADRMRHEGHDDDVTLLAVRSAAPPA